MTQLRTSVPSPGGKGATVVVSRAITASVSTSSSRQKCFRPDNQGSRVDEVNSCGQGERSNVRLSEASRETITAWCANAENESMKLSAEIGNKIPITD